MRKVVDIQTINVKPGRRDEFHRLLTEQSLPLQRQRGVDVVDLGPSPHDANVYYVIRAYDSLAERQASQDDFYASPEWRHGPRAALLDLVENYTQVVVEMEPAAVETLRTVPPAASPRPPFKPAGYPSVSVYIMASQAQRVIDFLAQTFDARPTRRFDGPNGRIMHAEVQIDDTIVMLADAEAGAFPTWLHVYVPDVDATYQRALAAGGVSVEAPNQKPGDPDRRGGVKDPAGNTWWIASQVG